MRTIECTRTEFRLVLHCGISPRLAALAVARVQEVLGAMAVE